MATFTIDSDNILQPLGIQLYGSPKIDWIPEVKDRTTKITGRDGGFDFGSKFGNRIIELTAVVDGFTTRNAIEAKKRAVAAAFSPNAGTHDLILSSDPNRYYEVKYAGQIEFVEFASHVLFTIPLKTTSPFRYATAQSTLTGTGTAVVSGNVPTPYVLEISGSVTTPTITINGYQSVYYDTLASDATAIIDTERKTVIQLVGSTGMNKLHVYSGNFRYLMPGNNTIEASTSNIVLRWVNRWI